MSRSTVKFALGFLLGLFLGSAIILASMPAQADSLDVRMGAGLKKIPYSAIYSIGYTKDLEKNYSTRLNVGMWTDDQFGHKGSMFMSIAVGRTFGDKEKFHVKIYVGVGFISHPDVILSTPLQFTEEFIIGYGSVVIIFAHWSNGGIKHPNTGRDYPMVGYSLEF